METVTRTNPINDQPVEATRFEVWSWRDGARWCAACPQMKDVIVKNNAPRADVVKACFVLVCNAVNCAKTQKLAIPWEEWDVPTVGMYSVNKYSIA